MAVNHLEDTKTIDLVKDRFETIIELHRGKLDSRMLPFLDILRNVPGVLPVWSCSGHTYEEQQERWFKRHNSSGVVPKFMFRPVQRRYLAFAVTEVGWKSVESMMRAIQDFYVTKTVESNGVGIDLCMSHFVSPPMKHWIPGFVLQSNYVQGDSVELERLWTTVIQAA